MLRNYESEAVAADRVAGVTNRAQALAESFTPSMFQNFVANVHRNPTLPVDAQLAVAASPVPLSPRMFDNLGMEYARQDIGPRRGQTVTPADLRTERIQSNFMQLTPDQQAQLQERVYPTVATMVQNGPRSRMQRILGGVGGVLGGGFGAAGGLLGNIPGSGVAYEGLKGFSRETMPALMFGEQMIQGSGRQAFSGIDALLDGDWGEGLSRISRANITNAGNAVVNVGQTDLAQRTVAAIRGENDLGNGFFLADDSQTVERRRAAEREMGTIERRTEDYVVNALARNNGVEVEPLSGQTYTIGRGLANLVGFDPGETRYNVMSGLLDATIALSAPGPEMTAARSIGTGYRAITPNSFRGVGAGDYESVVGTARGLMTVADPAKADAFLNSSDALPMINRFAELQGRGAWAEIRRLTRGSLDNFTITNLADAKTPDEVRAILKAAAGQGATPQYQGLVGRRLHDVALHAGDHRTLRRVRSRVPGRTINLNDGEAAVDTILDWGKNAKFSQSQLDDYAEQMGRAVDNVSRRDVYTRMLGETAVQADLNNVKSARLLADEVLDAAKVTDAPRRAAWMERMNGARGIEARRRVYDEMMEALDNPKHRASEQAREITRYMSQEANLNRLDREALLALDVGEWSATGRRVVGESSTPDNVRLPGASLLVETADELPLPNYREIRRATSWMRPLWEAGLFEDSKLGAQLFGSTWRGTMAGLGFMQGRLWKDMRLARLGYPLRVIPEEQLRRVADGGLLSHPFGAIGALLDPRVSDEYGGLIRKWKALLDDPRFAPDGTPLPRRGLRARLESQQFDTKIREIQDSDAFAAAMNDERLRGLRDVSNEFRPGNLERRAIMLEMEDGTRQIADGAMPLWKDEIIKFGSDPVMTRLARHGVEETYDDLLTTTVGREVRERLVRFDGRFADDFELRRYLESMNRRLEAVTGGNEQLLQVVRRGVWDDSIRLQALAPDYAPNSVIARSVVGNAAQGYYDQFTAAMFDVLATRPTNRFSRSPEFVRAYEEALIRLAPLAKDPEEVITLARRLNVRQSTLDTITAQAKGGGTLRLTHLDELSKKSALKHVEGLLYDTTRSSQFFDQYKLIFPFGEAWKEVITTWAKLFARDPFTITRRAQQVGQELQSNDFGQTYFDLAGLDKQSDEGFFYTNEYGQQVFYYPYSRQLTDLVANLPFDLEGGARNLNIAGELMPGIGPVAGASVHRLLPDNTNFDAFREGLFPFGPPGAWNEAGTWLPAWVRTTLLQTGWTGQMTADQQRLFANTQWRVMQYLYSTDPEKYQGDEGGRRLEADAKPLATRLYGVRGLAQGVSPAAPMVSANIVGPDGELVDLAVVYNQYLQFMEEDYTTALEKTLELYGQGALLVTQSNTGSTVYGGTPLSGAGYGWVRDNPDVAENHPQTYGFFAPEGRLDEEGNEIDFVSEAYRRSLDTGERQQLTQQQKVRLAEHRQASAIYRQKQATVPEGAPDRIERAYLQSVRANLRDRFPGFRNISGIIDRPPVWSIIDNEVEGTANTLGLIEDPKITSTAAGRTLVQYWNIRRDVVAQAEANGLGTDEYGGWRSADAGLVFREYLRYVGNQLTLQEPEFARLWDEFLSEEFKDDE